MSYASAVIESLIADRWRMLPDQPSEVDAADNAPTPRAFDARRQREENADAHICHGIDAAEGRRRFGGFPTAAIARPLGFIYCQPCACTLRHELRNIRQRRWMMKYYSMPRHERRRMQHFGRRRHQAMTTSGAHGSASFEKK